MTTILVRDVAALAAEMGGVQLGDARLARRMSRIVAAVAAQPSASFPKCFLDSADLEGFYRFVNNRRVTHAELLQPHYEATAARAAAYPEVRLISDTTEAQFDGAARRGLGPLRGASSQGFLAHVTLVVGPGEERLPLGTLGLLPWTRPPRPAKKTKAEKAKRRSVRGGRTDGESMRWLAQARAVEQRLQPGTRAIHLMDREADAYPLMCGLADSRFVIRAAHDRVVALPDELQVQRRDKLRAVLADAPILVTRDVPLSRRNAPLARTQHIYPARAGRTARLAIRARQVTVRRTEYSARELPETLALNVVQVVEVDVPAGEKAVEWILLSNLPIDTAEQVAAIVDHYRARWTIEEFNKALKTGCALEDRQLESLDGLLNVLAICLPIAWQLLLLRTLAQRDPKLPATHVLTSTQLQALRRCAPTPLPRHPTVRDALLAIARLGGHLRHNGEPGWQIIARGFRDLLIFEQGWSAARREI